MDQDSSVEEFLGSFAREWKGNDGAALGAFFTEDSSLINPFGQRADGAARVGDMYTTYFSGLLAGTSTTIELVSVRPVGSDHIFVDGEQAIHGADGEVLMRVHLAALLRRHSDTWRFVDVRPFVPAGPPR